MRKILTLFISFFVLFNASLNLYAFCADNVNMSDFDDFALECVQKAFTSNLSADNGFNAQDNKQSSSSDTDFEFSFDYKDIDLLNQSFSNKIFFYNNSLCGLSKHFILKDLYIGENIFFNSSGGLCEYKINLNSYIAIVVPNDNLYFIKENIQC
jgi:hypothetical protein